MQSDGGQSGVAYGNEKKLINGQGTNTSWRKAAQQDNETGHLSSSFKIPGRINQAALYESNTNSIILAESGAGAGGSIGSLKNRASRKTRGDKGS